MHDAATAKTILTGVSSDQQVSSQSGRTGGVQSEMLSLGRRIGKGLALGATHTRIFI